MALWLRFSKGYFEIAKFHETYHNQKHYDIIQNISSYEHGKSYMKLILVQLLGLAPSHYRNQRWRNFKTLSWRPNTLHFADNIFKIIFLNDNWCIFIQISLKYVSGCPINNDPALVQTMVRCQRGDKPLSKHMFGNCCVDWVYDCWYVL